VKRIILERDSNLPKGIMMTEYAVSWNERVFYAACFVTDAEQGSPEWWEALWANMEMFDNDGMDDLNIEIIGEVE
jgi:hypothetical protein